MRLRFVDSVERGKERCKITVLLSLVKLDCTYMSTIGHEKRTNKIVRLSSQGFVKHVFASVSSFIPVAQSRRSGRSSRPIIVPRALAATFTSLLHDTTALMLQRSELHI